MPDRKINVPEIAQEKNVSVPTLRRLPLYHGYLKKLVAQGCPSISCTQIAADIGLVPVQVRKDLQSAGIDGKPKVGYEVPELMRALEEFLGWNNTAEAFLVGAGDLGAALLGYRGFNEQGLDIVAAFDVDPHKIGMEIHGKKVLPMEKFPVLVKRMKINIGIMTVPSIAAQVTADVMVKSGIKAIWNFAPTHVLVPPPVILQNENLASSLAVLSGRLNQTVTSSKK